MSNTMATPHNNPFPGLRPFHEDEAHLFFGRESQVDAMVDKLAATHHDHVHRCPDKSTNAPYLALFSVSRTAHHYVAQHFENASQRSAELPGRPILRPVGGHSPIYLGLGVYGLWSVSALFSPLHNLLMA
mgnify:CR=1 FL=1